MKVLVLVMSARRDPWNKLMDAQLETWDSIEHPQTQTLYYCGKSGEQTSAPRYTGDPGIFYSPTLTESLEDVSSRTIEAFEFALDYCEWDFCARCHSSTYVHKKNLVDFIETLPKENVLCGLLTAGESRFLWGGGGYLLSRDVIERLVAAKDRWNKTTMEDLAITQLADELEIPFTAGRMASINQAGASWFAMLYGHGESFFFSDWADVNKAEGHYYWRCKQDLERHLDVEIMKLLKEHYV